MFLIPKPFANSSGGMSYPDMDPKWHNTIQCVGIIHGTISDDTGGKMAAVTPSRYILETIEKALRPSPVHWQADLR